MADTSEPVVYNRIAALRAERGVLREELASAVGVSYQSLGYIERGDYSPGLEVALRIGEYFGEPVEKIFSRRPFESQAERHLL